MLTCFAIGTFVLLVAFVAYHLMHVFSLLNTFDTHANLFAIGIFALLVTFSTLLPT